MGGVAYSAGRAIQEVGQEAGNIARKNPANCAADVLSRARRRFSIGVWTCSLRETQRQSHTDTQRHANRLSLSQLQPGIVRVRVAKFFWAMAQLLHASVSVQCKRPQHGVESGLLSEPLS